MSPSSEEQPVLEVHSLSAALGGKEILHDISFRLGRGCALSLVGENGSGKSTLLLALMGLLPDGGAVTAGHIFLNGKELTRCPPPAGGSPGTGAGAPVPGAGERFQPRQENREAVQRLPGGGGMGRSMEKESTGSAPFRRSSRYGKDTPVLCLPAERRTAAAGSGGHGAVPESAGNSGR